MNPREQWIAFMTILRKEVKRYTNLDTDTLTFCNHDVVVFCDIWFADWIAHWRDGRLQLYGICGAGPDYDGDCHKLLFQCGVLILWLQVQQQR